MHRCRRSGREKRELASCAAPPLEESASPRTTIVGGGVRLHVPQGGCPATTEGEGGARLGGREGGVWGRERGTVLCAIAGGEWSEERRESGVSRVSNFIYILVMVVG